jgi:hypothetical protein
MIEGIVVGVAAGAAAVAWLWRRPSPAVREINRFTAARAMTSRWALDPSTSPAPVLDIAARDGRPVPDQRGDAGADVTA